MQMGISRSVGTLVYKYKYEPMKCVQVYIVRMLLNTMICNTECIQKIIRILVSILILILIPILIDAHTDTYAYACTSANTCTLLLSFYLVLLLMYFALARHGIESTGHKAST